MAKLSRLTDVSCVNGAIEECRRLGRAQFLTAYGFEESRDYFLSIDGDLVDPKPIVAVAYGMQYPKEGPLRPSDFPGSSANAARALERLGLKVTTKSQLSPPELGDSYPSRQALQEMYGGVLVQGIMRFPGDDTVNVFSDADGPYADDAPRLGSSFGYRGEGLNGDQTLETAGNARLERARIERAAVRFWYRPPGGEFTFLSWVAVVDRGWVRGRGLNGIERAEIEWILHPVGGRDPDSWPETTELDRDFSSENTPNTAESLPNPSYSQLVQRVEERGQTRSRAGTVRNDFRRSYAARRAVLERSKGSCENPACTGMPPDISRTGSPILDIDHVVDLAHGGLDHPANMIAVCPNCHAAKTRGSQRRRWITDFKRIARNAHNSAI